MPNLFRSGPMSRHAVPSAEADAFALAFGREAPRILGLAAGPPSLRGYRYDGIDYVAVDWPGSEGRCLLVTIALAGKTVFPESIDASVDIQVIDATDMLQLVRSLVDELSGERPSVVLLRAGDAFRGCDPR